MKTFVPSRHRLGSRLNWRPPCECCGEENGRQVGVGALVVAGCDAAEILESAEHALNQISGTVGARVIGMGMLAGRVGRDHGLGSALGEPVPQFARVVGAVGEQALGGAADRQKRASAHQIVGVARRQREGDGAALIIGQGVDFRRPTAARGANSMMMSPPFAPAAERWALMWVESTLPVWTSDFPVSAMKIASQTPCLLQRL